MPWMSSGEVSIPDQDHRLAGRRHLLGVVGAEHDLAGDGARGGRQALGDDLAFGLGVERRVQELVERAGVDPADRLLRVISLAAMSTAILSAAGAVRLPHGLQDVELAALDRELDVLHLAVVPLERSNAAQLGVGLGQRVLHRQAFSTAAWAIEQVSGCGVRMPATSSPWALIRNSP